MAEAPFRSKAVLEQWPRQSWALSQLESNPQDEVSGGGVGVSFHPWLGQAGVGCVIDSSPGLWENGMLTLLDGLSEASLHRPPRPGAAVVRMF